MTIEDATMLAIRNVNKDGLTDIDTFSRPFELDCLKDECFSEKVCDAIKMQINHFDMHTIKIEPINHVLVPKKELFDYRGAALMHPMDTILYLSLVLTYADKIEKKRIPAERNIVFSYRFNPDSKTGILFDPEYSYRTFRDHSVPENNNILLSCDVSNYFDRCNIHRLESTLLSLYPKDRRYKDRVRKTISLLMFWTNKDSYGLPVGGHASRILAEAAFISIDEYLMSKDIRFLRFVDDYKIFPPNIEMAHYWINLLVKRLRLDGLSINSNKTKISEISDTKKISNRVANSFNKNKLPQKINSNMLIAGYTGNIPTKYRALSQKQFQELGDEVAEIFEQTKKNISNEAIVYPKDIRKFLQIIDAKALYKEIKIYKQIITKMPQIIPYFVDFIIKKKEHFKPKMLAEINKYFCDFLSRDNIPEYIAVAVIKVIRSYGGDNNRKLLLEKFFGLSRNSGIYLGRVILDFFISNKDYKDISLNRGEAIDMRSCYENANAWEQRAIIKIVSHALPQQEKAAWLRNIKPRLSHDIFAQGIIDRELKNKSSQKKSSKEKCHNTKTRCEEEYPDTSSSPPDDNA